jgi:ribosomal protein S18 acetylase RimI-like enzyme
MEQVNIVTLGRDEIKEAIKVVASAMGPTPFPMAMYRELSKSERVMETNISSMFVHSPGQVLIAKKDRQVVGVLRMVEWPQCRMSFRRVRILLPSMIRILKLGVIRAMKGRAVWAKYHPAKPHWHVDPLAVMPEVQGKGVGSQLLERFCKIIDNAGEPAYLETDRPENVRLYERFGFNVISEAPALGVHCYFMWRPSSNKDVE